MACTGTCTWKLVGGFWESSSTCVGSCACVDAIATATTSRFHDPTDPVVQLVTTLAGPKRLVDPSVRAMIEVLDSSRIPIGDIHAHVLGGGSIAIFRISAPLMLHRLKFLDGLKTSNPPLWAALDTELHSGATKMIAAAVTSIEATPSATTLTLPCSPT
jgi:hypothetical protein